MHVDIAVEIPTGTGNLIKRTAAEQGIAVAVVALTLRPLPYIARHVIDPKRTAPTWESIDRCRACSFVIRHPGLHQVAPRVAQQSGAFGGILPLLFRWQPLACPSCVSPRVIQIDPDDRMIFKARRRFWMIWVGPVPVFEKVETIGRTITALLQKDSIVRVRYQI